MVIKNVLLILFLSLPFFTINSVTAESYTIHLKNIQKIDALYQMDKEILPFEEVVTFSRKIIKNRKNYNNDNIAKIFILLANVSENKGDIAKSFQFAKEGLTLSALEPEVELNLLLKLADGYYIKGKYHQVLEISNQALALSEQTLNIQYQLIALSYRAVAYALVAKYQKSINDLLRVELLINQNERFSDHIELLEILAIAHYYLGDIHTASSLYQKIIKLRFELSKDHHIEKSYFNLARSYLELGRLDDAYSAFWQAKTHTEKKNIPIRVAYTELGLGQVLYQQENFELAYSALNKAEQVFKGQSLTKPYISTLISLAKASKATGRNELSDQLLLKTESLVENVELTSQQIEFYLLLSGLYESRGNLEKSLRLLNKYTKLNQQFNFIKAGKSLKLGLAEAAKNKSKVLAHSLADISEIRAKFSSKLITQKNVITLLSVIIFLLSIALIWGLLYQRAQRLNIAYDEIEQPNDEIASPAQTKQFYQMTFKMARKYEFPLAIGYLSIKNWQELSFHFNKKIVNDVAKTVATIINEFIGEFDRAGLINEGEYLILCPFQSKLEIETLFTQLSEALETRFFASLGAFTINIGYQFDIPTVQDIDPYIFLSRLSESVNHENGTL